MVFEPSPTTDAQSTTTSDSGGSLDALEVLTRISTMMEPLVQLLTVMVQLLTAITLVRKI